MVPLQGPRRRRRPRQVRTKGQHQSCQPNQLLVRLRDLLKQVGRSGVYSGVSSGRSDVSSEEMALSDDEEVALSDDDEVLVLSLGLSVLSLELSVLSKIGGVCTHIIVGVCIQVYIR